MFSKNVRPALAQTDCCSPSSVTSSSVSEVRLFLGDLLLLFCRFENRELPFLAWVEGRGTIVIK